MDYKILSHNIGNKLGCGDLRDNVLFGQTMNIIKRLDPDICLFQEILVTDEFMESLSEYEFYIKSTNLIMYRKSFKKLHVDEIHIENMINDRYKERIAAITLSEGERVVQCFCVHVPLRNHFSHDKVKLGLSEKSHLTKLKTLSYLSKILDGDIDFKYKPDIRIIGGDFNINFRVTEKNGNNSKWLTQKNPLSLHARYLVSSVKEPTTKGGMNIDAIFFQGSSSYVTKTIKNLEGDHYAIFSSVKIGDKNIYKDDKEKTYQEIAKEISGDDLGKDGRFYAYKTDNGYRFVHVGTKGGLYFYTPSYHKFYIQDVKKIAKVHKKNISEWSICLNSK